ncbi:MAG: family glycosyltransferase [Gemmataceae bacterium]|nr:family glycosyltransferase [Gemmataceae bacterium]
MNAVATTPAAPATDLDSNTVVLYFGNDWFAENRTSSHHLARQLANRFKVFYIECPGMRAPRGSGRDLMKAVTKVGRFLRGTRRVEAGIHLRTLFQIPFHRYGAVRWLNRHVIRATLGWMKWRHGIKTPLAWFHCPHVSYLVGALGEQLAVYYCTDDYAAYPGVHAETVRTMDADTARRADLVFVTSDTLLAGKQRVNPNTHVSPHGVEFDHFARAQDPTLPIPDDIAHVKGPVIGFFGLIESFVDLDVIDWLAVRRPEWQFLLLGRVAVSAAALPTRPNIHFIGKRPYSELPGYAKRFDACIIPYRPGDWSYHANPLKLREYLATGKPVVAIETPQTIKFADVVEVVSTRDEYLAAFDKVLATAATPETVTRRQGRVAGSSWAARADSVVERIRATLTERTVPKP